MLDETKQDPAAALHGGDLRVSFACPDCSAEGWALWQHLPRGMRCHACGGRFWIGPTGRLKSARQAKQVRLECPRCREVLTVLTELVQGDFVCLSCGLPLPPAGVQTSPGKAEAIPVAETKRRAREGDADRAVVQGFCVPWRRTAMVGGPVLAAIVLLAGIHALRTTLLGGESLQSAAVDFTRASLTGNVKRAETHVAAEHQKEFRRWTTVSCQFAIASSTAVLGNQLTIRAQITSQTSEQAVLRLTISHSPGGTILQTQVWRQEAGRWYFDPAATLRVLES